MTQIEAICEVCGGELEFNGEVVQGITRKHYRHRCRKCGHLQDEFDIYPKLVEESNIK